MAHAKVILFGEHAVVFGRTAVAAALDRGAKAHSTLSEHRTLSCRFVGDNSPISGTFTDRPAFGESENSPAHEDSAETSALMTHAYEALLDKLGVSGCATSVEVSIPGGAGLGCSAAMGVAITRAVAEFHGQKLSEREVVEAADTWERVFHGNPSGIDVAVASLGGVIAFRRGEPPRSIQIAEPFDIAVCFTGESSSTRSMVDSVARQYARRPEIVERTLDGIDTIAKKAIVAMESGQLYELGPLLDLNHVLLSSLMLSTETLERVCNLARDAGATGAKLTGGGGGGCAIAIAPGRIEHVLQAWRVEGFFCFTATIGTRLVMS